MASLVTTQARSLTSSQAPVFLRHARPLRRFNSNRRTWKCTKSAGNWASLFFYTNGRVSFPSRRSAREAGLPGCSANVVQYIIHQLKCHPRASLRKSPLRQPEMTSRLKTLSRFELPTQIATPSCHEQCENGRSPTIAIGGDPRS